MDHEGDSTETAVHVPADAPNEGIDFENNWMFDRYGRFRRRSRRNRRRDRGGLRAGGED